MRVLLALFVLLVAATVWAQSAPPATVPASQPAATEVDRLRRENADLKRQVETLRAEVERLKKQWNEAVRGGTGSATPPPPPAATQAAKVEPDGPGLYHISAGPGGRYEATIRAKSREDAMNYALKTVARRAMAADENAEIKELKVERVGN